MDNNLISLKNKMEEKIDILHEMLELTNKQRSALKVRDIATFQSLTEEMTVVYNKFTELETDFHNIYTGYKKLSGLPSDISLLFVVEKLPLKDKNEFKDLATQLVELGENLKSVNEGNLAIIKNSLMGIRKALDIVTPRNNKVYGGGGKLKDKDLSSAVLDKTV